MITEALATWLCIGKRRCWCQYTNPKRQISMAEMAMKMNPPARQQKRQTMFQPELALCINSQCDLCLKEYISQVSVRVFNANWMLTSQLRWSISVALYHSTMLIGSYFMPYLVPMRHFVSVCLLWSLVGRMRIYHTRQDKRGAGKLDMSSWTVLICFLFPPSPRASSWSDLCWEKFAAFKMRGFWTQTIRWPISVYEQKRISHEQGLISTWLGLNWTLFFFFFAIWRHQFSSIFLMLFHRTICLW